MHDAKKKNMWVLYRHGDAIKCFDLKHVWCTVRFDWIYGQAKTNDPLVTCLIKGTDALA